MFFEEPECKKKAKEDVFLKNVKIISSQKKTLRIKYHNSELLKLEDENEKEINLNKMFLPIISLHKKENEYVIDLRKIKKENLTLTLPNKRVKNITLENVKLKNVNFNNIKELTLINSAVNVNLIKFRNVLNINLTNSIIISRTIKYDYDNGDLILNIDNKSFFKNKDYLKAKNFKLIINDSLNNLENKNYVAMSSFFNVSNWFVFIDDKNNNRMLLNQSYNPLNSKYKIIKIEIPQIINKKKEKKKEVVIQKRKENAEIKKIRKLKYLMDILKDHYAIERITINDRDNIIFLINNKDIVIQTLNIKETNVMKENFDILKRIYNRNKNCSF